MKSPDLSKLSYVELQALRDRVQGLIDKKKPPNTKK
jgi:hypothetical protein